MKKLIALILASAILLLCAAAQADDYSVEQKFYGQMRQNGTKATVTVSAEGDSSEMLPDDLWAMLRMIAPSLRLEMRNCVNRGEGEAAAQLFANETEALRMDARYNEQMICLKAPFLSDKWLAAPANWDFTRLLTRLSGSDAQAPRLWHLVLEAEQAPEKWKKQIEPKITALQNKLGVWVNGYAVSAAGKDENGVQYSELKCSVSAEALKDEIRQLLRDVYADTALLSLLRQVALPEEAVYLTPAAQAYFAAWVDMMKLDGEVEIVRRYDAAAKPLLDSVSMPFAEGQPLSHLTLAVSAEPEGECTRVIAECSDGAKLSFAFTRKGETGFSGEIARQQAAENGGLTGFRFDGSWNVGEETYSIAADLCEKKIAGTLKLTPLADTQLPAQSLSVELLFSTRSAKRSPITLTAAVLWKDLAAGAQIAVQASVRTTEMWAVESVDALTDVIRLDEMKAEESAALIRAIPEKLSAILPLALGGALLPETP